MIFEELPFNIFVNKLQNTLNAVLIDVRTINEYESHHLANAICIDIKHPDFLSEIEELHLNVPYFIYCKHGIRSRNALMLMKKKGFTHLYHLKGGLSGIDKPPKK